MLLVRNTQDAATPAVLAIRSLTWLTSAVTLVLLLSLLHAIPSHPATAAAVVGITTAVVRLHRNHAVALRGIACAAADTRAEPSRAPRRTTTNS